MPYYTLAGCGRPLAKLVFAYYSSKSAMIAAAASHKTDITQDYTLADLHDLQRHPRAYHLHVDPSFIVEHVEFNVDPKYGGKPNPLSSANVRLALALAIDRYGLIESSASVSRAIARQYIAWTFLVNTPGLVQPYADRSLVGQWDPLRQKYVIPGSSQAIADARKLLARAGYRGGHFSVDFYTTSGNGLRAAQEAFIAASWAKLGVKLAPNFLPASKLFAGWSGGGTTSHGAFQAVMFAYLGAPDPDGFKFNLQSRYIDRLAAVHSSVNGNNSGSKDPLIDRDFNLAAGTYNSRSRGRYYDGIQVRMNKNAYWIPLYFRPSIATEDGRLANFSNGPTASGPEWNMFAWRLKR